MLIVCDFVVTIIRSLFVLADWWPVEDVGNKMLLNVVVDVISSLPPIKKYKRKIKIQEKDKNQNQKLKELLFSQNKIELENKVSNKTKKRWKPIFLPVVVEGVIDAVVII